MLLLRRPSLSLSLLMKVVALLPAMCAHPELLPILLKVT
jgi:hypothetical protein